MERYDVIQGAESFYYKGNDIGILVSHGFMGTPQSMEYIGKELAEKGFTVYGLRLTGHGTHYYDIEQTTYEEWKQDFLNGYQRLEQECRHVFILGQSMGGTLTFHTASQGLDLDGVIAINPAMTSIPSMEPYRSRHTPRYLKEEHPDIKDPNVHEITYDKVPVRSMRELLSLMDETKERLPYVTCPALVLTSTVDNVVPPENSAYILNHIQSAEKRQHMLRNSYHVASMDFDKDTIVAQTAQFVQATVAKKKVHERIF
ncbi:alpha/beta hydrolase [Priestia megaterium]|uniref:alpha/beta hydrolase n=1 Tax=Priestia megaterium TaxID=1404 RepID=UPI001FB1F3C5|nr:alpha/beta fold hydrolase [Priestia megaterium]